MKTCDHCKKAWNDCAVRKCPHPGVNQKYGENICRECCLKCKHSFESRVGLGCDLIEKG